MKNRCLTLFILIFLGLKSYSQTDTLDVFRTPSKNNNGVVNASNAFNNSLSISIGHLGRGGSMLTYERFISNTSLSVFAGFGVTKIDYIGQYSFSTETFYYANTYTERSSVDLGKMIDVGAKYTLEGELGSGYWGMAYSFYSNSIKEQVRDFYNVSPGYSRAYKLNYSSNEFKLIYGLMNDVGNRFYSDFYFGAGLRLVAYQELDIQENYVNYSLYSNSIELLIDKDSGSEIKPWLFFGWKIGTRF